MDSDDDVEMSGTPPELVAAAENVTLNLLPNKSREKYEFAYKRFKAYCFEKNTTSRSENVMIAYFSDLSTKLKASTLWSNYSMLRATLSTKEDIDISKYLKLRIFLKRQSDNYKPTKSQVLSNEQIEAFLTQAPDNTYLMNKVRLDVYFSNYLDINFSFLGCLNIWSCRCMSS